MTGVSGTDPGERSVHGPVDGTDVTMSRPRSVALIWVIAIGSIPLAVALATTIISGPTGYIILSRAYPGEFTAVVTTVLRVLIDGSSLFTVGALVHLMLLRAKTGRVRMTIDRGLELGIVQVSSMLWMLASAASVVFDSGDANGLPVTRVLEPGALWYLVEATYMPKAWIVVFFCAGFIFLSSYFLTTWRGLLLPLGASMLGVVAPIVVGQVQVGPDHDLGTDAAFLESLMVTALFGAVAALALRLVSGGFIPIPTLRRLGIMSAVLWPAIIAMEAVVAVFKSAGTSIISTPTGAFIIVKFVALAGFGLVSLVLWGLARRGLLRAHHISRLFAVAAAIIAVYLGASVAMTRIPPPQYFVPSTITDILLGFDVSQQPTLAVLVSTWRANLLFIVLAVAGLTVYFVAVLRLRRRGDAWPVGRTLAWTSGWIVVVLATSSGFGRYSGASFSVHMIVHMSLNMLAPLLLVMGGFVTLLLRATRPTRVNEPAGPHDWLKAVLNWPVLRFVYNPILVFLFFVGSYYALYLTELFGETMRFHWAHQVMNLHFLAIGYLFYGIVVGIDRPPRPLPHLGKLGFVLAAMPFHAFFGVIVMTGTAVIAETFYQYLDLPWATDLLADQYRGGGIAWAAGELPLIVVVLALAIQWSRQDRIEAVRKDRHLDSGLDDDFDAYNKLLLSLSERTDSANRARAEKRPSTGTEG